MQKLIKPECKPESHPRPGEHRDPAGMRPCPLYTGPQLLLDSVSDAILNPASPKGILSGPPPRRRQHCLGANAEHDLRQVDGIA